MHFMDISHVGDLHITEKETPACIWPGGMALVGLRRVMDLRGLCLPFYQALGHGCITLSEKGCKPINNKMTPTLSLTPLLPDDVFYISFPVSVDVSRNEPHSTP